MNLPRRILGALLGRRLARHHGRLKVRGPRGPIEIRRDRHGVPYVRATSDADAWFGLGFCHGQDRSFQLELLQRIMHGTLSALVGAEGLPIDRLSRRIDIRGIAAAQLAADPPDVCAQLEAFAAGVNAGRTRGARRPHELVLLRARPTPWDAVDPQAVCVFLCFALSTNWDAELVRLKILQADGPEALAALDPEYTAQLPVAFPPGALAGQSIGGLARDLAAFGEALAGAARVGGGSNAWAVAARKTAAGRPLLANDPHLQPVQPSHWYLARLEAPGWAVAGGGFVGIPAFVSGHNGHAAWGATAAHVDNTDLFVEALGPDGRSVREGDAFVPCPVRREVIEVRGAAPVVEEVLVTPRGPIVGPALDGPSALSLAGTWTRPAPYRGLFGIHRARTFAEARACFRGQASVSTINLVWASADDRLGWQLAAEAPVRRGGNGHLPVPGWLPAAGWEADLVPFDAMPAGEDPPAGFIVSANNQPVPNGDGNGAGPFLGVDWLDGYRAAAITEALAARDDWDVQRTLALQVDQRSIPWAEMRDAVLGAPQRTEAVRTALALLGRWDGRVAADSPAAAVYELFTAAMCRAIVRAKAPRSADWALGKGVHALLPYNLMFSRRVRHLSQLVRTQPPGFLPEPWPDAIAAALAEAVATLRARRGHDPARWAWGEVRPLTLPHPFGDKRALAPLFNVGPLPLGGDAGTIPQAGIDLHDPTRNPIGIPTLRAVIDLGAWDEARFVLSGGQSGNPLSPHYADMTPLWLRGAAVPIPWSAEAQAAATVHTLVLEP